jgi:hypothetical protein
MVASLWLAWVVISATPHITLRYRGRFRVSGIQFDLFSRVNTGTMGVWEAISWLPGGGDRVLVYV